MEEFDNIIVSIGSINLLKKNSPRQTATCKLAPIAAVMPSAALALKR